MKLYKYCPTKNIGKRLQGYLEQKIYFSPVRKLNDPFEGHFKLNPIAPRVVLLDKAVFEKFFYIYHQHYPSMTKYEFEEMLKSPEFRKKVGHFVVRDFFQEHGVFSLTSKNDSIPMWTYYASDHKGYCIEFEVIFSEETTGNVSEEEFKNGEKSIVRGNSRTPIVYFSKVAYSDQIPTVDQNKLYSEHNDEYLAKNTLGTKFMEWQHEQEFRLFANSSSFGFEPDLLTIGSGVFSFLRVSGVIAGSVMSEDNRVCVKNAIRDINEKSGGNITFKVADTKSSEEYKILIRDESLLQSVPKMITKNMTSIETEKAESDLEIS